MSPAYRGNSFRPDSCPPRSEVSQPGAPEVLRLAVEVPPSAGAHFGGHRNTTRATPEGQCESYNRGETCASRVRACPLLFPPRDGLSSPQKPTVAMDESQWLARWLMSRQFYSLLWRI